MCNTQEHDFDNAPINELPPTTETLERLREIGRILDWTVEHKRVEARGDDDGCRTVLTVSFPTFATRIGRGNVPIQALIRDCFKDMRAVGAGCP